MRAEDGDARTGAKDVPAGRDERRDSSVRLLIALLVVSGAVRLLWPGDASFVNDEPLILGRALDALEAGDPVSVGISGTRGVSYGPLPSWLYQLALLATSDLRWVVAAKALGVTLVTGWALVKIARRLPRLVAPLGAFAFLSPYLWFYARDLWDNSFAVPLSVVLLAAYVDLLDTGRGRALALTVAAGAGALLTHLMTAPLVGAVGLHLAVSGRRRLLVARPAHLEGSGAEPPSASTRVGARSAVVVSVAVVSVLLAGAYVLTLPGGALANLLWSPSPRSLLFALDGFRVLSLVGFDYVVGAWGGDAMRTVFVTLTLPAYAAGAYGTFLTLRAAQAETSSTDRETARVVMVALLLWIVLANGTRLFEHPHYYNGVWPVFLMLWWTGASEALRWAWARRALAANVGVMATFLALLPVGVHVNMGTRSLHYGPTLANQMDVAAELERLGVVGAPPSEAHHPRLFPHAIGVLRRLQVRATGGRREPEAPPLLEAAGDVGIGASRSGEVEAAAAVQTGGWVIVYENPDGSGGAIVLRRAASR